MPALLILLCGKSGVASDIAPSTRLVCETSLMSFEFKLKVDESRFMRASSCELF